MLHKRERERAAKREPLRERRQPRKRVVHGEENKKERAKVRVAKVRKRITAQRAKVRVATRISAQEREREREASRQ